MLPVAVVWFPSCFSVGYKEGKNARSGAACPTAIVRAIVQDTKQGTEVVEVVAIMAAQI
jgi:hypothetical protein